jgi:hypothetical protein
MNRIIRHCLPCAILAIISALSSAASPTPALTIGEERFTGTPIGNTTHGWEFVVTHPIRVTHLGLYDRERDGFLISHPIGLFRLSDSVLLVGGTMSAGTTDMLLDNFRYIDTPDLVLNTGESYVIAFHSRTIGMDAIANGHSGVVFNSKVSWTASRFASGSFGLPASVQTSQHKIGPNFLFVPEPTTIAQFVLLSLLLSTYRRKRG